MGIVKELDIEELGQALVEVSKIALDLGLTKEEVIAALMIVSFVDLEDEWQVIETLINNYEPVHEHTIHSTVKTRVITKQTIHSQVIMRKPKHIRARTTC
ncbi:hypothetical protein ACIQD3_22655 [Peribacillus loiseleuriae]|uniref:hypothetical protein n=1 Tax=Peribacillus loiseleuriae TaxID=1679170 RepID=UPI00382AAA43